MGEVMRDCSTPPPHPRPRLVVTGGAGFIGREVVAEALRGGHQVVVVVRPTSDAARTEELQRAGAEVVACGLEDVELLTTVIRRSAAVIHLAMSSANQDEAAAIEAVRSTERVIAAMEAAGVRRLVAASSFAVYDYEAIPAGSLVTEESPVVSIGSARDWYCKAKITEEILVKAATAAGKIDGVVLRLGAVYGPGRLWTGRLGVRMSRLWFCVGNHAEVPILWVRSAAECLVLAAICQPVASSPINVLDDAPPTQRALRRALAKRSHPRPVVVAIPWVLASAVGRAVWAVGTIAPGARHRLPSLLRPKAQAARFKPFRYSNLTCRESLGWRSRIQLSEARVQSSGKLISQGTATVTTAGSRV